MKCPNCGKETEGSPLECEKCGLIFSKYEAAQRRKAETPGPITKELSHKIGRAGITYIATGIIIIFVISFSLSCSNELSWFKQCLKSQE